MLFLNGARALRAVSRLQSASNPIKTSVRNSHHWYYRKVDPPPAINLKVAEVVQGVAWWWILWHLWTEPDHITGEFEWPDASKWTDAELGIPEELEL